MWPRVFVLFGVAFTSLLPVCLANANLRTLRTFRAQACEGGLLSIECWPYTVISITKVQYMKPADDGSSCTHVKQNDAHTNTSRSVITHCPVNHLLEVVELACKHKEECNMKVSPELFGEDPCPGVEKYIEVSYKCRPSTFYTKIVCDKEPLKLRCHKTTRIVIYNAWFGSTSAGVPECPQQRRHKSEDCSVEYATETAMNLCHGKLKCALNASIDTFGNPGCTKMAHLFLKLVYTCVSKDILQDLEAEKESDVFDQPTFVEESKISVVTHGHRERDDKNLQLTTSSDHRSDDLVEFTTAMDVYVLSDDNSDVPTDANCTTAAKEQKVIGFITEWIAAYKFISENKEKFILYLTVSLGAGLLAFLVVLAAYLYIQQQRQLKQAKLNISEPLPLTLDEDCSDVDQYDPRHDHSVEVVRYTNTSTVRRQDSDSHPRAPLSHSMNNYYYN